MPEKIKAPKVLVTKEGKEYIFKGRLYPHEQIYIYRQKVNGISICLSPSQIEKWDWFDPLKRPEPLSTITQQGFNECALASLSMLTGVSLDEMRAVFLSLGWEAEDGAYFNQYKKALHQLGFNSLLHDKFPNLPCVFTVKSLNVKTKRHSLYWDGSQVLDPQYNSPQYKWYGPDWGPEEIGGYDFITITKRRI